MNKEFVAMGTTLTDINSKIVTFITSVFTSNYVFYWSRFFPDTPLQYPPTFDGTSTELAIATMAPLIKDVSIGRLVLYPTDDNVKDYLCWRQVCVCYIPTNDVEVNNY
jgi:tRNA(His) guanylyltransferase